MKYQEIEHEIIENAKILLESELEEQRNSAFQKIRNLIDFEIIDLFEEENIPEKISIIYVSQKSIFDFWINFATDASFGLENVSDLPFFRDYLKNLGGFLKYGLEEDYGRAFSSLNKMITSYYCIITHVEKELGSQALLN